MNCFRFKKSKEFWWYTIIKIISDVYTLWQCYHKLRYIQDSITDNTSDLGWNFLFIYKYKIPIIGPVPWILNFEWKFKNVVKNYLPLIELDGDLPHCSSWRCAGMTKFFIMFSGLSIFFCMHMILFRFQN